jgi:hypothetical protein
MDFKIIIAFLFFCSFSAAALPSDEYNNEIKYAISYCLSTTYPDSKFAKDANYISGAYLQKGSHGLHVYDSIRNFIDVYVKDEYVSKHNQDLSIMQCIDLSTSNALYSEINKITNESLQ